ncbi:hypothetical protein SAMN04488505_105266 [Chitinophaga rupis]|uniref:Uncharacterized protein n=1 Tax=Chitinophaga rupis TaxID=573321 RepID=A0A1H7ZZV4_9BACT|nr:hypothetical protein SAMN04488505_105266 [Chitinophaga rupis]
MGTSIPALYTIDHYTIPRQWTVDCVHCSPTNTLHAMDHGPSTMDLKQKKLPHPPPRLTAVIVFRMNLKPFIH